MMMDRVRQLRIGTKLQALLGFGFVSALGLLLIYQTVERVKNTEAERRDANVRIVDVLAGPVSGALAAHDSSSIIYSFMEVLSQQPTAAGLVVVEAGEVIKTQQSLEHMELPVEALTAAALKSGQTSQDEVVNIGDYQLVAVPVVDSANRTIGAFAIGWSTKGLLDAVWRDALVQAGVLLALSVMLLGYLSYSVRRMVSEPIRTIAAALESTTANAEGAEATGSIGKYEARQDEMGALARALSVFQQRAFEVRDLNAQLDAALTNMPHGLCMLDADKRLRVCNARYAAMYGLPAHLTQPGTPYDALLDHRRSARNAPLNEGVEISPRAQLGDGEITATNCELQDGRTIRISSKAMPDGGSVASHEDITEAVKAEAQIAYLAHHDALTGLPNRVLFREKLERALARVNRGEKLSVLCLDLDHFKAVNDTLGHPIGDAQLKAVAERLQDCVRETDTVARLGGDEFAIVQVGIHDADEPSHLAQRIIDRLSAPYHLDGHQVVIGTSVGIALAPTDGEDADRLLKSADLALYRAKTDGRGTLRFFEPEMDARMQKRRALELDLRKALPNREFEVYYQPLVNLAQNRVSGFEALLRWTQPERGRVSPAEFIPLAEEIGLIGQIGAWVLRQACTDAAQWPEDIRLAVNLSPAQFKSRPLVLDVIAALGHSGLPAHRLELEITETVMLQDTDTTLATLHQLRELGVHISMDDFGTGYSALSYLRKFPFDKIKIDRSFTRDLPDGHDAVAIIRAVAGLGTSLGMSTTAEGVETAGQLEKVRAEGCTEVQGFYFSPAVPVGEIPRLLPAIAAKSRAAA